MLPALIPRNREIAGFIRDHFCAEKSPFGMQTSNDIHRLDHPLMQLVVEQFLAHARQILGAEGKINKMWGYMQEPGHPQNQREFMLHSHRAQLSIVYYARVPAGLPYPEGAFTLALPELVHVMPVEGMALTFGAGVEHEVFPAPNASGLRASVVASIDPVEA